MILLRAACCLLAVKCEVLAPIEMPSLHIAVPPKNICVQLMVHKRIESYAI